MIKPSTTMRTRLGNRPCAWVLAACLPLAAAAHVLAQSAPQPKVSFKYAQVPPAAGPAPRGLIVHVELQEGWHINSDAPADSFLVPTTVEAQAEGLAFGKPKYPEPVKQFSQVMGGDMLLFAGSFDIALPVSEKTVAGKRPPLTKDPSYPRTRVSFRYQSCNNAMCLPPKTVIVEDYGGKPAETKILNQ